jgi:hypothetical protein
LSGSIVLALLFHLTAFAAPKLVPHKIKLANGKSFDLNLPEGFAISIAAQGLTRVRFMALSPDNRTIVVALFTYWTSSTPRHGSSRRLRSI